MPKPNLRLEDPSNEQEEDDLGTGFSVLSVASSYASSTSPQTPRNSTISKDHRTSKTAVALAHPL
ncbi:hypothetical protein BT96DRAFT_918173, partial [Gymnopus androsaceus JB14]